MPSVSNENAGAPPIAAMSLKLTASALCPRRRGGAYSSLKSISSTSRSTVTSVSRPPCSRKTAASSPIPKTRSGALAFAACSRMCFMKSNSLCIQPKNIRQKNLRQKNKRFHFPVFHFSVWSPVAKCVLSSEPLDYFVPSHIYRHDVLLDQQVQRLANQRRSIE